MTPDDIKYWLNQSPEAKAEATPTDAQIDAAIIAWFESSAEHAVDDYRARMRAAIAAASAQQTNKDDPQ